MSTPGQSINPVNPELNPWSEAAHTEKLDATRPTAEDPMMFDFEDAVRVAHFSEVPGQELKGSVTGYYYENGQKLNIVELSEESRAIRAAEGFQSPTMIVPEGFINPIKPSGITEVLAQPKQEVLSEQEEEELREVGTQALDSASEPYGFVKFRRDQLKAMRDEGIAKYDAEQSTVSPEKLKDPALKEIFKPLLRPELVSMGEEEVQESYDYLFGTDEEHSRALANLADKDRVKDPIRRQQQEHDKYVNDETRKLAVEQLRRTLVGDDELATILAEHSFPVASIEAVDAIRTNEELRYAVGTHLLEKLNKTINKAPGTFGDRLIRNTEKANDFHRLGKSRMSSRAYASTLALSMIDGSFNGLLQTDSTEYRDGQAVQGQHRHAARSIL
jgi:hypothetical protein